MVIARSASWERGRPGVPGGAAPLGCFPPAGERFSAKEKPQQHAS
jgi:hypothetical protein